MRKVRVPGQTTRLFLVLGVISLTMALTVLYLPMQHLAGVVVVALALAILARVAISDQKLFAALIVAFALRFLLALAYSYVPTADPDPDGYGWRASLWATDGLSGAGEHFATGAYMYSWLISLLYMMTGESEFTVRMLNVSLGTLIVWCTYLLTFQLWGSKKIALRAAWIAAVFPNLIRFSASFPSREVIIVLLFTLGVILFIFWVQNSKLIYLLGSLAGFVCSMALHTGMLGGLIAVAILIVGRAIKQLMQGRLISVSVSSIGLLLVGVILASIWTLHWGLEKIGTEQATFGAFSHRVLSIGAEGAIGRAAYLQGVEVNTTADLLWVIPLRILYFLFTPFIWMLRTPLDLLGLVDALIYLSLAVALLRSRRYVLGNSPACNVAVLALVVIAVFAIATSNYGSAIRHRAKVAPLLISLAVVAPFRKYVRLGLVVPKGQYGIGTKG